MIKAGKTYYLYSSSPLGSFYTSNDMIDWRFAGSVFDHMPAWLQSLIPAADHVGAPDISYYEGQYLLYYQSHIPNTCNAATGLATNITLDPLSEDYAWIDHGLVLRSEPYFEGLDILCGNDESVFNAIDAHFFLDKDSNPWLAIGSTIGGIKVIRLDPNTLRPSDGAQFATVAQRLLLLPDPIIEAPYIHYRDGYYYLFLSFNHCCKGPETKYQVRVGRAEAPEGPYYDKSGWPLNLGGGTLLIESDGEYIGTGHADLFSEDGVDWLVHHAKLPRENYRAYLNIRNILWGADQWPSVCLPKEARS
jgi:arabinan endo-1,5-alpha-L-arabinosidase